MVCGINVFRTNFNVLGERISVVDTKVHRLRMLYRDCAKPPPPPNKTLTRTVSIFLGLLV